METTLEQPQPQPQPPQPKEDQSPPRHVLRQQFRDIGSRFRSKFEELRQGAGEWVTKGNQQLAGYLGEQRIVEKALNVGDTLPALRGKNSLTGEDVSFDPSNLQRPLVIKFFRGTWYLKPPETLNTPCLILVTMVTQLNHFTPHFFC